MDAPSTSRQSLTHNALSSLDNHVTGESFDDTHEHASVLAVSLSPDGQWIATVLRDKVRLLEVSTGNFMHTLGHETKHLMTRMAWSPSANFVAWGEKNNVYIWETEPLGGRVRTLTGHIGWVHAVLFTPDEQHVLSASEDGTIRRWDVYGEDHSPEIVFKRDGWIQSLAVSSDGKWMLSGSNDRSPQDTSSPDLLARPSRAPNGDYHPTLRLHDAAGRVLRIENVTASITSLAGSSAPSLLFAPMSGNRSCASPAFSTHTPNWCLPYVTVSSLTFLLFTVPSPLLTVPPYLPPRESFSASLTTNSLQVDTSVLSLAYLWNLSSVPSNPPLCLSSLNLTNHTYFVSFRTSPSLDNLPMAYHPLIIISTPLISLALGERSTPSPSCVGAFPRVRKAPCATWQKHIGSSLSITLNGRARSYDWRKTSSQWTRAPPSAWVRTRDCTARWRTPAPTSCELAAWVPWRSGSTTQSSSRIRREHLDAYNQQRLVWREQIVRHGGVRGGGTVTGISGLACGRSGRPWRWRGRQRERGRRRSALSM
ncbi:hypothetical protein NUW54_g12279 [Trametes sanguinea]|uniref:Uncharacterized protein n=1 Tax=Trametes sanguinea TaxID=158606 RepID=A0ACC1MZG2_9APHY|nr:hypothetical protein NUW54_g12279 [Trametes sanguinea]